MKDYYLDCLIKIYQAYVDLDVYDKNIANEMLDDIKEYTNYGDLYKVVNKIEFEAKEE